MLAQPVTRREHAVTRTPDAIDRLDLLGSIITPQWGVGGVARGSRTVPYAPNEPLLHIHSNLFR